MPCQTKTSHEKNQDENSKFQVPNILVTRAFPVLHFTSYKKPNEDNNYKPPSALLVTGLFGENICAVSLADWDSRRHVGRKLSWEPLNMVLEGTKNRMFLPATILCLFFGELTERAGKPSERI